MEALKDIFRVRQNEEIFSRSRLWLHCAAVSICSQMITERIFGQKGEDAFLCGILHDIGMIVENQAAKDQFAQACEAFKPENDLFTAYEQRIIGTDHCEIGYLLASEWNLPAEVNEGIRNHHRNLRNVLASEITGTVQIAEYMVCKLNFTALPGMNGKLSAPLAAHIRNYMSEYEALARDLPNEISKAKDLYDSQQV
jgi:putative nucleotidyltransferase with HDIG domain